MITDYTSNNINEFLYINQITDNIYQLKKKRWINIDNGKYITKCIIPVYNYDNIENNLLILLKKNFIVYNDNSIFIIEGSYKTILTFITQFIDKYNKNLLSDKCICLLVSFISIILINHDYIYTHEMQNNIMEIVFNIEKYIYDLSISELIYVYHHIQYIHLFIDINIINKKVNIFINVLIQLLTNGVIKYECNTELQLVSKYINSIILELTQTYSNLNRLELEYISPMVEIYNNDDDQLIKIFKIWLFDTCKVNNDSKIKCTILLEKYKNTMNNNISIRGFGKLMRLCTFESKAIHGNRYYCNLEFK